MVEGDRKPCGNCKTEIIHVKITKSFKNKTETKLQWQNVDDKKPHFKYISDKNYECIKPTQESTAQAHADEKEEIEVQAPTNPNTIIPNGPFEEAELIIRWARERAYKITMAEVIDINKLSVQEKSGLGQAQGMLTRALVDTTIELMKIHGIKTEYKK